MRAFILRTLLCALVATMVAFPCYAQMGFRGPVAPGSYNVYYPWSYYSSYRPGPYNGQYYSTTSPYFGTPGYYDPVPYGSSWYSGYYDAPVYNGGHRYNYEPSYRN